MCYVKINRQERNHHYNFLLAIRFFIFSVSKFKLFIVLVLMIWRSVELFGELPPLVHAVGPDNNKAIVTIRPFYCLSFQYFFNIEFQMLTASFFQIPTRYGHTLLLAIWFQLLGFIGGLHPLPNSHALHSKKAFGSSVRTVLPNTLYFSASALSKY